MYHSISDLEKAVLTDECQAFLQGLHRYIRDDRQQCLNDRQSFQARVNHGQLPDFIEETQSIREGN